MTTSILVLVENLSVPFDRRVWQESQALAAAGYRVTVICPRGHKRDTEPEEVIEGVRILRYPLTAATGGPAGYVKEYGLALWHTLRLALKVRREGPVHAVHACNPPDLLLLAALPLRAAGAKLVFDHHDLVPELFYSRFPDGKAWLHRGVKLAERLTFAAANGVISTNESYRRVALTRGHKRPEDVVVVRSAPDLSRFVVREPDPQLRRGRKHLAAYVGVMGPQDGVDYALRALAHLHDKLGRDDLHTIFMGTGDTFDEMVALSHELGIAEHVEFPGRVSDEYLQRCLSSADVCLSPDPPNPLNDVSTMNKVVEYMAMGRPMVSFDLPEARVSAGDAAVYAPGDDEVAFAELVDELLGDPQRRAEMGRIGRARVESALSWDVSRQHLLEFYERLVGPARDTDGGTGADDGEQAAYRGRDNEDTHAGAQHFCRTVRERDALPESPRVLVAGCGRGHEARHIHDTLGGELVGVDVEAWWDPELGGAEGDPFHLRVASVQDLPYPGASFDVVFYHHVIEHVPDPVASLRELARVLRPGGLIYVGTPNRHRVVGYLGSYDSTLAQKLRWNAADWSARLRGRFRNELGAHAGFAEGELRGLLQRDFTGVEFLTSGYLAYKYGSRLPAGLLSVLGRRPVREFVSPSVYAVAQR